MSLASRVGSVLRTFANVLSPPVRQASTQASVAPASHIDPLIRRDGAVTWKDVDAPDWQGPAGRPFATLQPITFSNWNVGDDELAFIQAEQGRLQFAAQLCEAIESDGVARGLLTTRSAGLLRLPLSISGIKKLVEKLLGGEGKKRGGIFWKMFPTATLARIIRIGIMLGAGIGYFVETNGIPVLHVIEHQYVYWYRDGQGQRRVFYQTQEGDIEITPGDGRWFAFAPFGWDRFWLYGAWRAVGKFWLAKNAAVDQRTTWGIRLARGILWIEAPRGSTTGERDSIVADIAAAIYPPVISMLEGWKLTNIDIQGRGFEVWKDAKDDANNEITMALTGQLVTSGAKSLGFGEGNIFADIAKSFIEVDAEALAESVHFHGLAPWARVEDESEAPWAEWDTVSPSEKKLLGEALEAYGKGLSAAAKGHTDAGVTREIDAESYADEMGIVLRQVEPENDDRPVVQASGVRVVIDVPEFSLRNGTGPDGKPWAVLMTGASYGEIVGTTGPDGEPIDAYVGPFGAAKDAFILEQLRFDGTPDEFKVFLGFFSLEHAQTTYRRLCNQDLEGEWATVPAALIAGLSRGEPVGSREITPGADHVEPSGGTNRAESTADTIDTANVAKGGGQIFAYHITTDTVKMREVRASVGREPDPRMAEMYPTEWAAYLRREAGLSPDAASTVAGTGQVGDDAVAA